MARFIGIDWDHDSLYLITGAANRRKANVDRALIWSEPHSLDTAAAEEAGKRLRQQLKDAKIAPAPVLACLGRDRVIFKELRFPPVEAKQEPSLVQFQAGKELTEPLNRVVIDYTISRLNSNAKERVAQVAVVRRNWLASLQALCKGAGLPLVCLAPRSYGIARCLRQTARTALTAPAPAAGATVAVLTICQRWAEFTIVRDGEIRLARPLAVNDNLLEDVRRNLALYANQNQSVSTHDAVRALYFAGGSNHAAMQERLREVLAIPVHALDPFAEEVQVRAAEDRGGFTGLVGLVRLWAEQQTPINFLAPKEPKPETNEKRRMGVLVAGLVFVLLVGLFFIGRDVLAKKAAEVQSRKMKLTEMNTQLEKLKPDQQKLAALIQWDQTALSWLDELLELTEQFPKVKDFHVTQLRVEPLSAPVGKQNFTMQLRIKGEVPTKKNQVVYQLIDNLNQLGMFQASLEKIKILTGQDDGPGIDEFEILVLAAKKTGEDVLQKSKSAVSSAGKK